MRAALAGFACVAWLMILTGPAIHAHEIGTTRVSVVFGEHRTYRIDVVTDAAALLDKLETTTGRASSTDIDPVELRARLRALDEIFRGRLGITYDEAVVRPDVEYSVAASNDAGVPPQATVRLTGEIPADARQFAWTYSWTFASYALTVRRAGSSEPDTEWLEGGQISRPFLLAALAPPISRLDTTRRYVWLGFTHIVPKGLDHMLFVLGIFLLTRRVRPVLWQVSAFTVAHSITLGLSMYGLISVAPRIVEPLIALSIAYVAIENVFMSELKPWRVGLVFAFGLLHGMGFAGALKELGLPRSEFVTALLTFNLGVEAGQLAVIGAAFLVVGWYCGNQVWYRRRVVVPASALIACVAVYWTIERFSG